MEEKPYRSLNEYYRSIFGRKAAKISLDGGFTCPNRDGTCGTRGCLFCSAGGSGDFACIGFSGIYIGNNWKCDGADRISRGIGSTYDCENVFVLCRNGIIA